MTYLPHAEKWVWPRIGLRRWRDCTPAKRSREIASRRGIKLATLARGGQCRSDGLPWCKLKLVSGRAKISRRQFLQGGSLTAAAAVLPLRLPGESSLTSNAEALQEFSYGDVTFAPGLQNDQLSESHGVLLRLDDDALLKPFRQMDGKPAPGRDIGGWYRYDPDFNPRGGDAGFAPAHCFGQWVSSLARGYAISGSQGTREKVLRLNGSLGESISGDYFEKTRFPAYSYDKLVCGLIDSHRFAGDPNAFSILDKVTDVALPHLPDKAIERDVNWRAGKDFSYGWDESYTLPENLYLAAQRGAGKRYRDLAAKYLMDETFFDPLAQNRNVFAGRHAYSTVNSLSSGMQAYLSDGSEKHLLAVKNAYEMLMAQSFATGGWGPDEQLRSPDSDDLFASLTKTHNSFETPCGSYAHFKLTRALLRVTRDSRYGDSMERVMYNTVLGAKPLLDDGQAFYYADYNVKGSRVYSDHGWPCCSGTLPQVAADYRINTYFREGRDVYVNLYIPSTVRWTSDGKEFALTQESGYPLEETVRFKLALQHASKFALHFRIPAWAEAASVVVNGQSLAARAGSFLRVERKWKNGDQIVVNLPMTLRTEAIDPRHPETVALLRGPLVLFAAGDGKPALLSKQLLAAREVQKSQWLVETSSGKIRLIPFTDVGDSAYSTYLTVS